jgi:hypothetical protein
MTCFVLLSSMGNIFEKYPASDGVDLRGGCT